MFNPRVAGAEALRSPGLFQTRDGRARGFANPGRPCCLRTRRPAMTQSAVAAPGFVEEVEIHGHIIDSLILPKVLDEILTHGGSYVLKEIRIGQRQTDPSFARIEVRAPSAAVLEEVLDSIHDHGAVPTTAQDCTVVPADMDGAFPEGFYSTT